MKHLVLFTYLFTVGIAFSQSGKLKKADNYYTKVAYSAAAEIYTDLIGSEVDSPNMKAKLADCYYQIGETSKATEYYQKIEDKLSSDDMYRYAQALKENKSYDESDRWMNKYYAAVLKDNRAIEFNENKSYLTAIESQDAYFSMKNLSINTERCDFGGYPSPEGVFFVSDRRKRISIQRFHSFNNKRFLDLYTANSSEDGTLSNPDFFSGKVNKKFHEGPICYSPDNSTVYYTRNNMSSGNKKRDQKGIQNLKIYRSEVSSEGTWKSEVELNINSQEYSVGHPTVTADGKWLYFTSDMPGGLGGADIYKALINKDGSIGKPQNLGSEVNTEGQEMFPWLNTDGLLLFSSDGHLGLGGLDVFAAVSGNDGRFKKLVNLGAPVNSNKDDFALILGSDNVTGYVSSNRESGKGGDDIYSVKLLRPIQVSLMVEGIVADVRTLEILPGATINLTDAQGKVIKSVVADATGKYSFELEEDQEYTLEVRKDKYFNNNGTVSTKNLAAGTEVLKEDLTLEKNPGLSLYALVSDSKTNLPLEGVAIILLDNMTGESTEITTPSTGAFLKALNDKKLNDRGSYNLTLVKEGYIPKTVTYNASFDHEGQYDVHSDLDLSMDPMVEDLRDLIEINPINFDLGKWNIRNDAKVELDKIVEVMNKYPDMVVELGSHTDCRASKPFNMRLSDKRAKSSASYIKSKITNPERIYGKGYGESKLLNGCECEGSVKSDCSEEEHEKNRRTEFKVVSVE